MALDFSIKPIETKKNNIPLRGTMKAGIIPKSSTLSFICGRTGSGKSQLLLNLMLRPEFYGKKNKKHYFHEIHVFSPTARSDDIYQELELDDEFLHDDLSLEALQEIIDTQKKDIETKGIDKAKRICIIYDDVQSNPKFMRSKEFSETVFANRHISATIFILGQSYTQTPRKIRLQARYLFYFAGSNNEDNLISQEFCPPRFSQQDMLDLIHFATEEPYSFLYVNTSVPFKDRYRKNLTDVIDIYGEQEEKKNND